MGATVLQRATRRHKSDRIEQVETGIRQLLRDFDVRAELQWLSRRYKLHGRTLLDAAWQLWDRAAADVRYLPAKDDAFAGAIQVLRRPSAILSKGGDCDDLNLVLFGGLLRELHGGHHLFSVYMPNQLAPKHVVCGLQDPDGTGRWMFDICEQPGYPSQRGPARPGVGYWVPWEF